MQLDDLVKLAADPERMAIAADLARELSALREREAQIIAELEEMGVETSPPLAQQQQRGGGGRRQTPQAPAQPAGPQLIGPPAGYEQFHKDAWAAGIEIQWFDDNTALARGERIPLDEVQVRVRRMLARQDEA